MDIQELNFNKDEDIILIQFLRDEDLNLIKRNLRAVYETFIKRSNNILAISDDMDISIIHTTTEKEEKLPF